MTDALAFGRFRLECELARQPGRSVHRATDVAQDADVLVALKILDLSFDTGAAAQRRFDREVAALQRLRHPGIVPLHAAGLQGRRAWIATRFIEGGDLRERITPGRPAADPLAVLGAVAGVAEALGAAHRQGVLHRDIKPANVLVQKPGDRLLLADFGLAGLHDGSRTQTGVLSGSPVYMAPEVLAGAAPSVAADLYALGALLYEWLTGQPPHRGTSLGELLRAAARDPVPAASANAPGLPADADRLIAACLARTPAARPSDATALAQALAAAARPRAARGP
jgi:serine/threonine-protein kinase